MARNEIRLYVCEDDKWGLAKRYHYAGQETSALGAAKLSMVASGVGATMVAHCFNDPKDGAPCYFSLLYLDKPGVTVPPPPLLGRLSLQRPALPAAPAKPEPAANETKSPPPPPAAKAIAERPSPRPAGADGEKKPPPPRAEPAAPTRAAVTPRELVPSGVAAALRPIPAAEARRAPMPEASATGFASGPRADPPVAAPSTDGLGWVVRAPQVAAAPFSIGQRAAAAPANPVLQEIRARMLQFLEACLTHPITQKYLPPGGLDPKNRFGLHLLALGAGQACLAAAPGALLLPDIVEEALGVLGSDPQKARAFAEAIAEYTSEAKNATMIQAGREIMTAFQRDQTLPAEQLNRALQLWNTVQRGEEGGAAASQDIAIMFTDMVSSVETTQQLGDDGMMKLVDQHNLIIGAVLKTMGGHQVKHTGDGIMAVFPRVADGVAAAAEIQRQIADFNATTQGAALKVRIGLSAGNPIRKDDDYFGTVVQTAARVCPVAGAGEIALSDAVTRLPGCESFTYSEPIAVPLKGFPEPQLVRKLIWSEGQGRA
jgi:adenylate cyclase